MLASTCRKQRWLLLAVISFMPFLSSCAVTVGGQRVFHVQDPFVGQATLKFERMVNPCIKGSSIVLDNLGENGSASLWKDRGDFYLVPNGDVEEAFYVYRPGGLPERYDRRRGIGKPIYGPNWKLDDVRNAGTNAEIMLIVVVYFRGQSEPWVGKYPIYNQNLREMCQGYNQRR